MFPIKQCPKPDGCINPRKQKERSGWAGIGRSWFAIEPLRPLFNGEPEDLHGTSVRHVFPKDRKLGRTATKSQSGLFGVRSWNLWIALRSEQALSLRQRCRDARLLRWVAAKTPRDCLPSLLLKSRGCYLGLKSVCNTFTLKWLDHKTQKGETRNNLCYTHAGGI